MNYAVIDCRLPSEMKAGLRQNGFELIELPPFAALQPQVASHPDMLLYFGKNLITAKDYYAVAKAEIDEILKISGKKLEFASEAVRSEYPYDVRFNAFSVGKTLFCSKKGASGAVLDDARRKGQEIVFVKQGYAKCSTVIVSDDAIITADGGIACAAEQRGIDTLIVAPGCARLDGYATGFLGGASGTFRDTVFFCGDISGHPDCEKITEFCEKHEKKVVSLSPSPLFDAGTIFFI